MQEQQENTEENQAESDLTTDSVVNKEESVRQDSGVYTAITKRFWGTFFPWFS